VQVGLRVGLTGAVNRHVKVDDQGHLKDVDTCKISENTVNRK
jgi:hypothetical protein